MKIACPDCDAVYNISDHKIKGRTAKTVCRKCGAQIFIGATPKDDQVCPKAPEAQQNGDPAPNQKNRKPSGSKLAEFSVVSLASKYPRYRDPLIIVGVALVFLGILTGIHFAAKGTESTLDAVLDDPIQYIAGLILGVDKYELCQSYLDRNQRQLAVLGQHLKYYPVKKEVRVRNGRETAIVVVRVQGARATKDVIFQLQEQNNEWKILEVTLDLGGGRQQRLYP